MSSIIPLLAPNLKENELKCVTEAIEAEWVSTGGVIINRFKKEISAYLDVEFATAVNISCSTNLTEDDALCVMQCLKDI